MKFLVFAAAAGLAFARAGPDIIPFWKKTRSAGTRMRTGPRSRSFRQRCGKMARRPSLWLRADTNLAMDQEGLPAPSWFNAMGVTAFVLNCRMGPRYRHPIELGETQRAVRLVRSRTAPLGVAADRIGMMGFSAGGHLAATAATHFDDGDAGAPDPVDRVSSRPDFLILAYPVIAFDPAIAHPDSVRSLLGDNPSFELRQELSAELPVTPRTPPTLFLASRQVKVPAEMNIFENGPHGVGLDFGDPALGAGPTPVKTGLRTRGVL